MKRRTVKSVFIVIPLIVIMGAAISITAPGRSEAWTPPEVVSLVSHAIKASKYQAAVAITGPLQEITGVKFRVRPEAKEIARMEVMRLGRAEIGYESAATHFFAAAGRETFNKDGWGPQPIRTIWVSSIRAIGYMVRGDSGIKTPKDLEGKRVPNFIGNATVTLYMNAMLKSFAEGVNYKLVPVSGWPQSLTALKEGAVDVGWCDPWGPPAKELEAGPHGVGYIQLPLSDKRNWSQLRKIAPFLAPVIQPDGAGITSKNPLHTVGYNDRWITYDWKDENLVYWFTKNLDKAVPKARDLHQLIKTWTTKDAVNIQVASSPYHPGAIRYFKEAGLWGEREDRWQEEKLAEEQRMIKEWKAKHPDWKYMTKGK